MTEPRMEVLRAGMLSTVQDLGRPGLAHLGVPRSGAADTGSLQLANRLIGNPPGCAAIETTLLGVDARLSHPRWVAVTGATCRVSVDGRPAVQNAAQYLHGGATLSVGPAENGVRSYLAVAGGIACPPVLGSRSTDLLSGIGPAPLTVGTVLGLGAGSGEPAPVDVAPRPRVPELAPVRLVLGPHDDVFSADAVGRFLASTYLVSSASNRIGVRLEGTALDAGRAGGLPSEGIVLGAVQLPPGAGPIIFLADHPTTGGYPVLGVVHPDDLWMVAQAAPGTRVRFCRTPQPSSRSSRRTIRPHPGPGHPPGPTRDLR